LNGWFKSHLSSVMLPLNFISNIPLNAVAQWMLALQQIAMIEFRLSTAEGSSVLNVSMDLKKLSDLAPMELDNHFGLCPIPLYELGADEVEVLNGGGNIDDVKAILLRYDLIQYFFPAPDQLAIGLVDRGSQSTSALLRQLTASPKLGHPFGACEVVKQNSDLAEIIDSLQQRKLLVEGEFGLELSQKGTTMRQSIRFKPREGLVSKLLSRLSLKINLKNLIGIK
jgi:hypothetical protein